MAKVVWLTSKDTALRPRGSRSVLTWVGYPLSELYFSFRDFDLSFDLDVLSAFPSDVLPALLPGFLSTLPAVFGRLAGFFVAAHPKGVEGGQTWLQKGPDALLGGVLQEEL